MIVEEFNEEFDKACEEDGIDTEDMIQDMRFLMNILHFYPYSYPHTLKELCKRGDAEGIPMQTSLDVVGQLSEILDNRPEIRCQYTWGQD